MFDFAVRDNAVSQAERGIGIVVGVMFELVAIFMAWLIWRRVTNAPFNQPIEPWVPRRIGAPLSLVNWLVVLAIVATILLAVIGVMTDHVKTDGSKVFAVLVPLWFAYMFLCWVIMSHHRDASHLPETTAAKGSEKSEEDGKCEQ